MSSILEGWEKIPIQWMINAVKFPGGTLHLGFCQKTKKIAIVAPEPGIEPLFIKDAYVKPESEECEEQSRCLCVSCPFNKTTWKSYKKQTKVGKPIRNKADFENWIDQRKKMEKKLEEEGKIKELFKEEKSISFSKPLLGID